MLFTPYHVADEAETLDGIVRSEESELNSEIMARPIAAHSLTRAQSGLPSGSRTAPVSWHTSEVASAFRWRKLTHDVSGIDAGVKLRPSERELAIIGPEFRQLWSEYYANAPDKPVMWLGILAQWAFRIFEPSLPR